MNVEDEKMQFESVNSGYWESREMLRSYDRAFPNHRAPYPNDLYLTNLVPQTLRLHLPTNPPPNDPYLTNIVPQNLKLIKAQTNEAPMSRETPNGSNGKMATNTQPTSSDSGLGPVNPFVQQPFPEETLINWVNEKPDESVIRQQIADQIQIVNGKPTVQGDLNLFRYTGLNILLRLIVLGILIYSVAQA